MSNAYGWVVWLAMFYISYFFQVYSDGLAFLIKPFVSDLPFIRLPFMFYEVSFGRIDMSFIRSLSVSVFSVVSVLSTLTCSVIYDLRCVCRSHVHFLVPVSRGSHCQHCTLLLDCKTLDQRFMHATLFTLDQN